MSVGEMAVAPPTEIVRTIRPSNGGVLVAERGGPSAGVGFGYVCAVGGGVPWIQRGDAVWYRAEGAGSLRVELSGLPQGYPPINYLTSDNDGQVTTAFVALVDQRDVLAVQSVGTDGEALVADVGGGHA